MVKIEDKMWLFDLLKVLGRSVCYYAKNKSITLFFQYAFRGLK